MDGSNVTILIAFTAGILSFASPCCLPMVPVYLAHMAEVSVEGRAQSRRRLFQLVNALAFVLGFTIVFVSLWASLGLVGYALRDKLDYLRIAGGTVLVFMGFHLAGVINLGFLNQERVLGPKLKQRSGVLRSFLFGFFFSAGWTPCIGPVLGAVIGLAAFDGDVGRGTILLLAYSAGLGVPFIASAMAVDTITAPLKKARALRIGVPIVSGALVAGIGFLMVTNTLVRMPQYFNWGGGPVGALWLGQLWR
ncbi:MAG: cytochrome c biogenesis protein CcdA [Dehalococcoidia bacterium]|nr:MAG: cytochrome c biogenesis protein CcdA [Dehalococcoidia bacterium]